MSMHQPLVARSLATADQVNAAETSPSLSCEDLGPGKQLIVTEETNSGTATLQPEWSPDGSKWFALGATIADSDFVSSAPIVRALTDAGGNDLPAKEVRLRATAYAASGVYGLVVVGRQLPGYR